MTRGRIAIVDLNRTECPSCHSGRLTKLLAELPAVEQVSVTPLLSPRVSESSQLVILCFPVAMPLREAFQALTQVKNGNSVLGLFCSDWAGLREGAKSLLEHLDDFIACPFMEFTLSLRVERLLARAELPPAELGERRRGFRVDSLVGESKCFVAEVEKIPLLAGSDVPVLISGETGTGKELFARAIHYHSPRQGNPFIPVNCGAIPDHLVENELFGHAKGAFTDASCAEKGLVAEAEGGTLFLDEVDTLSPSAQIKLLRFLQDRTYRLLGSSKSIKADVRILAATNTDLRQRVVDKLFRDDLYHRLNVLSLAIPPLRARPGDIARLATNFLARQATHAHRKGMRLSSAALQKLEAYPWLGNVRELEGVIQRAVIMSPSTVLDASEIELAMPNSEEAPVRVSLREAKRRAVGEFERTYLTTLLATSEGNITKAAKAAGKERRTFQRLLRKYGLDGHSFRTPT